MNHVVLRGSAHHHGGPLCPGEVPSGAGLGVEVISWVKHGTTAGGGKLLEAVGVWVVAHGGSSRRVGQGQDKKRWRTGAPSSRVSSVWFCLRARNHPLYRGFCFG